ncbi:DUF192 domain-containing protein [Candidatus Nomurabacteria bacterium]|nr:DUF192 domain-containing protein [Candidatus Nomurabacteria bacterium]
MKKYLIIALLCLAVILALLQADKKSAVEIAGKMLLVDVARTDAEKSKGLSGKDKLNENEGMLFVFEEAGRYPFWMKDMKFPIDIIWLMPAESGDNSLLTAVYIERNAKPESYPNTFNPKVDSKYVLEVVSGLSEKNNLKIGDTIFVEY